MERTLQLDKETLTAFLQEHFSTVADDFVVEDLAPMSATIRLKPDSRHVRPGGTLSGPSMFALADVGVYLTIISMIGPEALTVTTNASLDFMRKPAPDRDLLAKIRLLKLGRVLAVGDVLIFSDGKDDPVARATLTYSIPPSRSLSSADRRQ